MPILLKAHMLDGSVLRCDENCHESLDPHRPCLCMNSFTGVGFTVARQTLPVVFRHLVQDIETNLPDIRSLEIHFKPCKYHANSVPLSALTPPATLALTQSTPPDDTEPSGSTSHHH